MFEIVEAIPEEPVRLPAVPGAIFKPGLIAQFTDFNGETVCELSDGKRPIGIVDDFKVESSIFNFNSLIRVWVQRMIFRTDEYDKSCQYRIGMPLYVNEMGMITGRLPGTADSVYVARLITPPTIDKPYMEALWL